MLTLFIWWHKWTTLIGGVQWRIAPPTIALIYEDYMLNRNNYFKHYTVTVSYNDAAQYYITWRHWLTVIDPRPNVHIYNGRNGKRNFWTFSTAKSKTFGDCRGQGPFPLSAHDLLLSVSDVRRCCKVWRFVLVSNIPLLNGYSLILACHWRINFDSTQTLCTS